MATKKMLRGCVEKNKKKDKVEKKDCKAKVLEAVQLCVR
jgi:hypothetical protein